jgi:hypothetical protein
MPKPDPTRYPPGDWSNIDEWDQSWKKQLSDSRHAADRSMFCPPIGSVLIRYGYLEALRARGGHRVLFAGNGICLEPLAFAHAGFDAVALDISSVACRFVETFEMKPEHLAQFFLEFDETVTPTGGTALRRNPAHSLERVAREHVPGGKLTVLWEDLFLHEPASPYHLISSRRAFQKFSPERQLELARLFFRWLHPGGCCVVETLNLGYFGSSGETLEHAFREAGFFLEDRGPWQWYMQELSALRDAPRNSPAREAVEAEYQRRMTEVSEQEALRRAAGEKQMLIWNSTG